MEIEKKIPSFKVIVLGDSGVGKTSLANRQSKGQFTIQMTPTIGTSHMKTIVSVTGVDVELKIWDTAGQEQFASLVSMYARGANVCILVASFIDQSSIENLDIWKDRLFAAGENPPIIVAINKVDLQDGAPMTLESLRDLYSEKYPNLFFVSARTGDGVNELFAQVATEALKIYKNEENKKILNLNENNNIEKKKNGCCFI